MISLPGFRKTRAPNGDAQQANGSPISGSAANASARYDHAALEALVQRAELASEALRSLESTTDRGEQFAAMERRIAELEGQLAAAEQVSAELDAIRSRSAEQAAAQERVGAEITATGAKGARIASSIAELAGKIDGVLQLRDQMDRVEELNAQFASMNGEASAARSQIRDLVENISRLRTVHDDVLRAHKHATIRLDGLDQRHQTATNKMDVLERRAESADESLEALLRLAHGRHQTALRQVAQGVGADVPSDLLHRLLRSD